MRKIRSPRSDSQRLANVIACKNVIKDQSLPLKLRYYASGTSCIEEEEKEEKEEEKVRILVPRFSFLSPETITLFYYFQEFYKSRGGKKLSLIPSLFFP